MFYERPGSVKIRYVELRLTGTALQTLADNAHIPGWPGMVGRVPVADADPDAALHRATVAWYQHSAGRRVGRGTVITGQCTPEQAVEILTYLEGVSGALLTPGVDDAEVRREGRAIGRAVDQAIEHMRRRGATIRETPGAAEGSYTIEV